MFRYILLFLEVKEQTEYNIRVEMLNELYSVKCTGLFNGKGLVFVSTKKIAKGHCEILGLEPFE